MKKVLKPIGTIVEGNLWRGIGGHRKTAVYGK